MTTLADMPFEELRAGMKFRHPEHGEQIILDLGRGPLGPEIAFHDSEIYSGRMPRMGEEEGEVDIYQLIARATYPHGAADWEYLGLASPDELAAHGWQWFHVDCPHCGFVHRLLAPAAAARQRRCQACGMVFERSTRPNPPSNN